MARITLAILLINNIPLGAGLQYMLYFKYLYLFSYKFNKQLRNLFALAIQERLKN